MHVFFAPNINDHDEYTLNEEESRHCVKVLRLKTGNKIILIDGRGGYHEAVLKQPDIKRCKVDIVNTINHYGKRDYYLHMAVAPTKNHNRFEWFVEKATEIGIDEITPIICEHAERQTIKYKRLEKVIISSMKQSVKAFQPKLNNPLQFSDFINCASDSDKFLAHCYQDNRQLLTNSYKKGNNALLCIGPEGDFSKNEVEIACKKGFIEISLGEQRLRTETAGVIACHTVSLLNQ